MYNWNETMWSSSRRSWWKLKVWMTINAVRDPARLWCCKTQVASVLLLLDVPTTASASGIEKKKKTLRAVAQRFKGNNWERQGTVCFSTLASLTKTPTPPRQEGEAAWRQQAIPAAPVPAGSCWCGAWCSPAWCRRSAWTRTGAWSPPARSGRWAGCSCGQRGCRHWRTPPGSEIDRSHCLQRSM